MKTFISIFCFVIVSVLNCNAQNLTCQECRTHTGTWEFIPYRFCDPATNTIKTICVKDPYAPHAPYQDYKVLKLCLPLTFGTNIVYDNTEVPRQNLGPWVEQIWAGETLGGFEYKDADMPALIQAAADFWQDICSPHNNEGCQDCPIKIAWTRDALKMEDDLKMPVHTNTPLKPGCEYDCSQFAILLNATSGYTQFNGSGKPSKYFFTRGSNLNEGYSGKYVANWDMRTQMIHSIGMLLGIGETDAPVVACFNGVGIMRTGKYSTRYDPLEIQGIRFESLDASLTDLDPNDPDFVPNTSNYSSEKCAFILLYCCDGPTSVDESKLMEYGIEVFPNPTDGLVTVRSKTIAIRGLTLVDITGHHQVLNSKQSEQSSESLFVADLKELTSGQYTLILDTEQGPIATSIFLVK